MRAVVYNQYGGPDVLQLTELPEPKLGQNGVLVRIKAAALNPADIALQAGYGETIMDTWFPVIPGWDVAGVVEAVGAGVDEFAPGDEVIGYARQEILHHGTLAEKIATPVETLARKPTSLSFPQASCLPLAGLTAYRAIHQKLEIQAGERVLILGASGSVGSLAAQLALEHGANVVGTSSKDNFEYLQSLGITPVAYGAKLVDDLKAISHSGFDVIFDAAGHGVLSAVVSTLAPGGRSASVAAHGDEFPMVYARLDTDVLNIVSRLAEQGKLKIRVAKTFPLERVADAQRKLSRSNGNGKIVIEVS